MVLVARERYKRRNKLKQVREEAGFTQTKAAELMGINRTALAKIENGYTPNPNLATLKKFADLYGVPIEDMFFEEVQSCKRPKEKKR